MTEIFDSAFWSRKSFCLMCLNFPNTEENTEPPPPPPQENFLRWQNECLQCQNIRCMSMFHGGSEFRSRKAKSCRTAKLVLCSWAMGPTQHSLVCISVSVWGKQQWGQDSLWQCKGCAGKVKGVGAFYSVSQKGWRDLGFVLVVLLEKCKQKNSEFSEGKNSVFPIVCLKRREIQESRGNIRCIAESFEHWIARRGNLIFHPMLRQCRASTRAQAAGLTCQPMPLRVYMEHTWHTPAIHQHVCTAHLTHCSPPERSQGLLRVQLPSCSPLRWYSQSHAAPSEGEQWEEWMINGNK